MSQSHNSHCHTVTLCHSHSANPGATANPPTESLCNEREGRSSMEGQAGDTQTRGSAMVAWKDGQAIIPFVGMEPVL